METEVIYLSSDGEEDSQKENKKKECVTNSVETKPTFSVEKVEDTCDDDACNDDDERVEGTSLKRKVFEINENNEIYNVEKRQKLSVNKKIPMVIIKPVSGLFSVVGPNNNKRTSSVEYDKDEDTNKPKLIVKEIKRISYVGHDIFPLFISLCLQKCPPSEKKDMEKIIDKLKRRYEQLDPAYASSEKFALFLNEKRQAIVREDNRKIYVYIQEVMNEMKRSIKKKSQASQVTESYDAVPSTSYVTNNESANNTTELDYEDNEESKNSAMNKKMKLVLKAMSKCEARIKELEEAEIDFNEESNSTYLKLERYKERMVDLYSKLCELTGENADAGRVYLRPKHVSPTGIVVVDQAITNFINSKIVQRNHNKKYKTGAEKVIFPDCKDIVECINHCNETRNLGLDKRKVEQMAKKAFKEIGEHLQRVRHRDYWDTFSLYLENTNEDPAIKNEELAKKLSENRVENEKRLSAVFEKYSKKQEEIKEEMNQDVDSIASDEEDESVMDDEDELKDDLSAASSDLESSEENVKIDEEIRIGLEKNGNSANANGDVNENIPSDEVIALQDVGEKNVLNKVTVNNTLQRNIAKKLKIISVESDVIVSKVGDKTIIKKIQESCAGDAAVENTQDVPLTTVSTTVHTNNIKTEEDPNCVRQPLEVITDTAILDTDVIINENTQVRERNAKEEAAESVVQIEEEIITTEETEIVTQEVTDVASENVPSNQQAEEEKVPLLRVRSFAKPPTTWEDNTRLKAERTSERTPSKVEKETKEVIDLTNETAPKSVASKCTIKVGSKVIPVLKTQTVVIPAGNKNIINVQNITNNYLKLNSRPGQIIGPVREVRSIIVPSVQTNSSQNQPQNSNAGTIHRYRIIRPKTISGKKTTAQPTAKQADVCLTAKKSK